MVSLAQLDTLVILGGNPALNAPADVEFASKLSTFAAKSDKTAIHLSHYVNETSVAIAAEGAKNSWHLPRAHFLEGWGDCRSCSDG